MAVVLNIVLQYEMKTRKGNAVKKMELIHSRTVLASQTRYKNCKMKAKEACATCNTCIRWNGLLFPSKSIDAKFFFTIKKIFIGLTSISLEWMGKLVHKLNLLIGVDSYFEATTNYKYFHECVGFYMGQTSVNNSNCLFNIWKTTE